MVRAGKLQTSSGKASTRDKRRSNSGPGNGREHLKGSAAIKSSKTATTYLDNQNGEEDVEA